MDGEWMNACKDGCMNTWIMDEWRMDGEWMDGWRMDGCMHGWIIDKWMDG